jgi:4-hydroxy-3-methylbut-2-enyl diphosphate reductase
VHRQAQRQVEAGRHILFVGHKGHPEVIGTMGQVPEGDHAGRNGRGRCSPRFSGRPAAGVPDPDDALGRRYPADHRRAQGAFPAIIGPRAEDICYATSNRQAAVKAIAPHSQLLLVIGAPNSSNSVRLVEVAEREGTPARLIQRADDIDPAWLDGVETLGLTAGASAPEVLVREVVARLAQWRDVTEETVTTTEEHMVFKLPRQLVG